MPVLKTTPEDFVVEEVPLYAPRGEGGHTWIEVEKRLCTTEEVAAELAAAAGVAPSAVGWAGRKDREAVARQWLSVPGLDAEHAAVLVGRGWRALRAVAHPERLRLGELVANRFRVVVREVDETAAAAALARLPGLVRDGMPNFFGEQRFGADAGNVARGARLLRGEGEPGGRRQQRLYLSALQAAVFNDALRTRSLPPHRLLPGDLALVHASGALLGVPVQATAARPGASHEELSARADRFEVSPTGPLLGHKMRSPRGEALRHEQAAAERLGVPWIHALPRLHGHLLPGGRRPLRVPVGDLLHRHAGEALELSFALPPGSYATVLVAALFAP